MFRAGQAHPVAGRGGRGRDVRGGATGRRARGIGRSAARHPVREIRGCARGRTWQRFGRLVDVAEVSRDLVGVSDKGNHRGSSATGGAGFQIEGEGAAQQLDKGPVLAAVSGRRRRRRGRALGEWRNLRGRDRTCRRRRGTHDRGAPLGGGSEHASVANGVLTRRGDGGAKAPEAQAVQYVMDTVMSRSYPNGRAALFPASAVDFSSCLADPGRNVLRGGLQCFSTSVRDH